MIQITYLRERYSVLAPSWMAAFAKARDHLVIEGDLHPNDESYVEDITDLEYLLDVYEGIEYNDWANLQGNTFRMDDTEAELYTKEYDGCLLDVLKGEN